MKNLKKLPTKQLEKFSNIFTQLGLVLVLFIVYVMLEHQTEQKSVAIYKPDEGNVVYVENSTEVLFKKEPIVVTKIKTPRIIPLIIDAPIVKGKNESIETIIDTPKETPALLNPEDIIVIDIPSEDPIIETVPFINIENAPVFKGCEGLNKAKNKVCFDKKMKQFVQRNFDAGLANRLGLHAGVHKIQTQFLIDDKGNVIEIKIRAPHKQLKKEVDKLINKLPKFTPGKQRNKPVKVRYSLPIAFSVE